MQLHTYLNFDGTTRQAFDYYAEHLGGKILGIMTYSQMPEPRNIPPGSEDRIMHARMALGETYLMASDTPPGVAQPMRSVYLTLSVDSDEEAERIHGVLSKDGEIYMALQETFFATRFSMLRDRFGVSWMILHSRPMPGQGQAAQA